MKSENTAQKKSMNSEVFALRPTPLSERKSMLDMVWVQAGCVICIPAFMLGGMLGEGMSTWMAVGSGTVGYLLTCVLMILLGMQGADLGMPTCAISQSCFGKNGTRLLVSLLFSISLMGFFGLQINVCGEAFANLVNDAFGWNLSLKVSSIIWGIVMSVIAVIGMEGLKIFDKISVPMLFLVMLLGLVLAFRKYGTEGIAANEVTEASMSFAEGVALSFSFFSAMAFTAADVTRWQKNRKDTIKSSIWGLMPAGIATCLIGVLLARVTGVYDVSLVLSYVGLPVLGLLVIITASVSTNSLNAYCGGLDTIMTFNLPDNRRKEATAAVCIVGMVLAILGILNWIEEFLNWICFMSAPVAGVMIADYWIVGKGNPKSWHAKDGWNWVGCIVAVVSMVIALFIPFGVFNMNGVVVAIILYLIVEHFVPSQSRKTDGGVEIPEE